jgi:hypothetical protein
MFVGIVLMCVDYVLASPRLAQANPGRRTPHRGGSVTQDIFYAKFFQVLALLRTRIKQL